MVMTHRQEMHMLTVTVQYGDFESTFEATKVDVSKVPESTEIDFLTFHLPEGGTVEHHAQSVESKVFVISSRGQTIQKYHLNAEV
jgi:hypothetical protein